MMTWLLWARFLRARAARRRSSPSLSSGPQLAARARASSGVVKAITAAESGRRHASRACSARSTRTASTSTSRAACSSSSTASAARRPAARPRTSRCAMLRDAARARDRHRSPIASARRSPSPTTRSIAWRRLRPEWNGMACVLTVAVVDDGRAIVGHVGDTRLYKLRDGRIEKVTRDHSPVGEREDAHEISEARGDAASAAQRGVSRRRLRAARAARSATSSTSHEIAVRARRGAAALQRRPDRPGRLGDHQRDRRRGSPGGRRASSRR